MLDNLEDYTSILDDIQDTISNAIDKLKSVFSGIAKGGLPF